MNSKEISKLIDRLEDALIAEHRLIKENVELKEKVLDYARRLDEANEEIDLLNDRVEELEENLRDYADRLYEASDEIDLLHDKIEKLERSVRNYRWLWKDALGIL